VLVVGAPLRAGRADAVGESADPRLLAMREELEAEREAKYREIRDAELDYRTGKLSLEDYTAVDGALRAQALRILNRIEELGPSGPGVRAPEQDGSPGEPVDD
jgi:hypothetical protein